MNVSEYSGISGINGNEYCKGPYGTFDSTTNKSKICITGVDGAKNKVHCNTIPKSTEPVTWYCADANYGGNNGSETGNSYCKGTWESTATPNTDKNMICIGGITQDKLMPIHCADQTNTPTSYLCATPNYGGNDGSKNGNEFCKGEWDSVNKGVYKQYTCIGGHKNSSKDYVSCDNPVGESTTYYCFNTNGPKVGDIVQIKNKAKDKCLQSDYIAGVAGTSIESTSGSGFGLNSCNSANFNQLFEVQQGSNASDVGQKVLRNLSSNRYIDAGGGGVGAPTWYLGDTSDANEYTNFSLEPRKDNLFMIRNKPSNGCLDISTSNLKGTCSITDNQNQLFELPVVKVPRIGSTVSIRNIKINKCLDASKIATTVNSMSALLTSKSPWGIYAAETYSNNKLPELRGNTARDATCVNVNMDYADGNGAVAKIPFIFGGTNATVEWPSTSSSKSIPDTFTICSISRYNGSSKQRVIASTMNWLHGHHNGNRGVCHYNNWVTAQVSVGNVMDWVVVCGKKGGTTPNNILVDSVGKGTATNGSGNGTLAINKYNSNENSDWALSYVFIWDVNLTDAEMVIVSNTLRQYLVDGISLTGLIASTTGDTNNGYGTADCSDSDDPNQAFEIMNGKNNKTLLRNIKTNKCLDSIKGSSSVTWYQNNCNENSMTQNFLIAPRDNQYEIRQYDDGACKTLDIMNNKLNNDCPGTSNADRLFTLNPTEIKVPQVGDIIKIQSTNRTNYCLDARKISTDSNAANPASDDSNNGWGMKACTDNEPNQMFEVLRGVNNNSRMLRNIQTNTCINTQANSGARWYLSGCDANSADDTVLINSMPNNTYCLQQNPACAHTGRCLNIGNDGLSYTCPSPLSTVGDANFILPVMNLPMTGDKITIKNPAREKCLDASKIKSPVDSSSGNDGFGMKECADMDPYLTFEIMNPIN